MWPSTTRTHAQLTGLYKLGPRLRICSAVKVLGSTHSTNHLEPVRNSCTQDTPGIDQFCIHLQLTALSSSWLTTGTGGLYGWGWVH
jgi:hypothetical protein